MIELRPCESDDDLEAWRRVRIAVVPNEITASVEEMRRTLSPERLMLLAYRDGELAGSGAGGRGDTGSGFAYPRVLREHRRRGIGAALLQALATHVEALGLPDLGVKADDEGALAFAEHFGFVEVGREIEQVREVAAGEPWPTPPDGVELVTLVERPDLLRRLYEDIALQAFEDMPTPGKIDITPEQWEREWVTWPEATFAALADGEVIGMAGLIHDPDRPDRAENALTAVRRDYRGRGLARALKETAIAWASERGLREIYTWTQTGNANMRAVNERLGYVTRTTSISMRRKLPL
jgi:GNAT superfamily N-acetyltransferase